MSMIEDETTSSVPIEALQAASHLLQDGRAVAMATVIETWGSAAVPVGGQMAIASEDAFHGSVSGGCVEADVISAALDVIASGQSEMLSFGVSDDVAWRAGLACGGKIRIHVAKLDATTDGDVFRVIETGRASRRAVVVAIPLATGPKRAYLASDAGVIDPNVASVFETGASRVVEQPGGEVFFHLIAPAPRIVIVGATHIAQILAKLAQAIDYDVVVLDPRSAFASEQRFGDVAIKPVWPSAGLQSFIDDAHTAVVALTHANAIDDEALAVALKSKVRYIGALGSRKTHDKRLQRLHAQGFSDDDTQRIRAPIGLDIGAKSAGEIATAILSQVVSAFRSGQVS